MRCKSHFAIFIFIVQTWRVKSLCFWKVVIMVAVNGACLSVRPFVYIQMFCLSALALELCFRIFKNTISFFNHGSLPWHFYLMLDKNYSFIQSNFNLRGFFITEFVKLLWDSDAKLEMWEKFNMLNQERADHEEFFKCKEPCSGSRSWTLL